MTTSRRRFLQSTLGASAVLSAQATMPQLLARTALAAGRSSARATDDVLVVVQLSGGNDGLNTVIPYADSLYGKNRLELKIDQASVLKLDDEIGLHPSLKGFVKLAEAGRWSVVQGVGYPNPDRSHFSSMDIWHTAERTAEKQRDGWLGRSLDRFAAASGKPALRDTPALHLGGGPLPLALVSRTQPVPSIESLDGFRLRGERGLANEALPTLAAAPRSGESDMLAFLQRTTLDAYAASARVQEVLKAETSATTYPAHRLAGKLANIAKLIDAGLETRVYYVSLDGFDTHANQRQTHAALLTELSESVTAFVNDLVSRGQLSRTCVLMFSEFGRRVKENASLGTDHGAAAPLFLAGGGLRKSIVGKHPRLDDLDKEGDLKFHTDFRSVYASILQQRLRLPAEQVLGAKYEPAELFA